MVEFGVHGAISPSPTSHIRGTTIFAHDTANFSIEHTYHCTRDSGYAVALDI